MRTPTIALGTIGAGVALAIAFAGNAQADSFTPDYSQVANGDGIDSNQLSTPGFSPVQVPAVSVEDGGGTTTVVAHPFLSPWVHQVVPVPAGTAVELRGAVRVALPGAAGLAGGPAGTLVVNPNGHCVFAGPGTDTAALTATAVTPVRVDVPFFDLVIEPTLYR